MSHPPSEFPIVIVKNLPYSSSTSSLYELFGNYGNIYQVRIANENGQPGTCFIIYNNIESAVKASKGLNGVNFQGRYLVAHLYQVDKSKLSKEDFILRKEQLENLKKHYGIV